MMQSKSFSRTFLSLAAIGLGAALLPAAARAAEPVPAPVATALTACRSETSDLKRLQCFDAAANGVAANGTQPAPPASGSGSSTKSDIGSIAPPPVGGSGAAPASPTAPPQQAAAGTGSGSDPLPAKLDLTMPDDQKGWIVRRAQSPLDKSLQVAAALPSTQAKIERLAPSGRTAQKAALIVACRNNQTDVFVAYLDIVDGMGPIPVEYKIDDEAPVSDKWGISQDFQSYGVWHTPKTVPLIKKLAEAHRFAVHANPGPMGVSEAEFDLTGMADAIKPVAEACHW